MLSEPRARARIPFPRFSLEKANLDALYALFGFRFLVAGRDGAAKSRSQLEKSARIARGTLLRQNRDSPGNRRLSRSESDPVVRTLRICLPVEGHYGKRKPSGR